jgi:REP element-mobilizing transposase RayT
MELQFFDPAGEVLITHRKLPHWEQPGAVYFITFRTQDSLPKEVLSRMRTERCLWLRARGIAPDDPNWRTALAQLSVAEKKAYHLAFTTRWFDLLDEGHGECVLREPAMSQIVADSLRHFDGDRYVMRSFVVMPNHIHMLAQFPTEGGMKAQCESWKRFTATKINRELQRQGYFWQGESFDHLVRSEEQYFHLVEYIANNPRKAGLSAGEYRYYRRKE